MVLAIGVRADGHREVLGLDVGDSENGAFWTGFLRSLAARGLGGVKLVIADAHLGLGQAVRTVLLGAGVQRCRVHFMRNVLGVVSKPHAAMVAALIRTIFAQPDAAAVGEQLDVVAGMLGRQFPKVTAMLEAASDELLAFTAFPVGHWKKIWSTNPLERLEQGGQTALRRGRGLPQPCRPAPLGRCGPGRATRRMAGQRPPLPLRSLHGRPERCSGQEHRTTGHRPHHGIMSTH